MNFEQLAVTEVLHDSNHVVGVVGSNMIVRWLSQSAEQYELDAVGSSIIELIHPDDVARAVQAFQGARDDNHSEPMQMANTVVPIRVPTPGGVNAFNATGRWVVGEDGNDWLVVILNDVSTHVGVESTLRALAQGAGERESIHAVLAAARHHRGVDGAQILWSTAGSVQTAGDLGQDARLAAAAMGDIGHLDAQGKALTVVGRDWGYAFPIDAGEQLGTLVVWGAGTGPKPAWVSAAMRPLLDIAALVIQRSRELAELERRATTDEVTGLCNRHSFLVELEEQLARSALIYIDLDEFKLVNDAWGHTVGDRVLSIVGRRLADAVPRDAIVARIGGDEFAVLCRNVSQLDAHLAVDHIAQALNKTIAIDGRGIEAGASIGLAHADAPTSGRVLLDNADQALLEAKAQGKGCFVLA